MTGRTITLLAILFASPAAAADWRNIGMDFDLDLQSIRPDGSARIVAMRHTDLASEGLPPPAATAVQHYRFDCRAGTAQGLDVAYFDRSGRILQGSGPYPVKQVLTIRPGGFLATAAALICPAAAGRR